MSSTNLFRTFAFVGGGVLLILFSILGPLYGAVNYGADTEARIEAEHENLQNILSNYTTKVAEAAQVPEMYANDLREVIAGALTARYGENGAQSAWMWLQERYPGALDAELYGQLMRIIEAGRNEFANGQTRFLDVRRGYDATLDKDLPLMRGWWLSVAGYPTLELDDYGIVTTEEAREAFDGGNIDALNLRDSGGGVQQ